MSWLVRFLPAASKNQVRGLIHRAGLFDLLQPYSHRVTGFVKKSSKRGCIMPAQGAKCRAISVSILKQGCFVKPLLCQCCQTNASGRHIHKRIERHIDELDGYAIIVESVQPALGIAGWRTFGFAKTESGLRGDMTSTVRMTRRTGRSVQMSRLDEPSCAVSNDSAVSCFFCHGRDVAGADCNAVSETKARCASGIISASLTISAPIRKPRVLLR
ncbi:hypothetical protein BSTAB16_0697 [Burkholderia stabilis]|uniref:Uncharacterized protein n=1 Tax=Burkholderia stabilis TaxID=95485 RepID=A0AAJ5T2T5_9BURK|nr:hypothetical protein BSTAB16_0697 [Burkholderia stabilis]